jgi:hypothetical protein
VGENSGGRIGETFLPRAGGFGDPAVLDLRLVGRVGGDFGDGAGGHELRSHLGQVLVCGICVAGRLLCGGPGG